MKPPTGTVSAMANAFDFQEKRRGTPLRATLPGEPLPERVDLSEPLDFEELELRILYKILNCKHEVFGLGFCRSCGLNRPGIEAFEEFKSKG